MVIIYYIAFSKQGANFHDTKLSFVDFSCVSFVAKQLPNGFSWIWNESWKTMKNHEWNESRSGLF